MGLKSLKAPYFSVIGESLDEVQKMFDEIFVVHFTSPIVYAFYRYSIALFLCDFRINLIMVILRILFFTAILHFMGNFKIRLLLWKHHKCIWAMTPGNQTP